MAEERTESTHTPNAESVGSHHAARTDRRLAPAADPLATDVRTRHLSSQASSSALSTLVSSISSQSMLGLVSARKTRSCAHGKPWVSSVDATRDLIQTEPAEDRPGVAGAQDLNEPSGLG